MADTTIDIDAEQRPEPEKPVRLNRKTRAHRWNDRHCGPVSRTEPWPSRIFEGSGTAHWADQRESAGHAKTCDGNAELDLRRCHAAEGSGSCADPRGEEALPDPEPPRQSGTSEVIEDQMTSSSRRGVLQSSRQALKRLRQVQPSSTSRQCLSTRPSLSSPISSCQHRRISFPAISRRPPSETKSFLATGARGRRLSAAKPAKIDLTLRDQSRQHHSRRFDHRSQQ